MAVKDIYMFGPWIFLGFANRPLRACFVFWLFVIHAYVEANVDRWRHCLICPISHELTIAFTALVRFLDKGPLPLLITALTDGIEQFLEQPLLQPANAFLLE